MKKKIDIIEPKSEMIGVRIQEKVKIKLEKLSKKYNKSLATIAGYIIVNEIENYE